MVKRMSRRTRSKNRQRRYNHSRKMIGGIRHKIFQAKILKPQTSKAGVGLSTNVRDYAIDDLIMVEKTNTQAITRPDFAPPPLPPPRPGVPQPNPLPATPEMDETYVKVYGKEEWILVKTVETANPANVDEGFLEYKSGIFQPNIFSAKMKEDTTSFQKSNRFAPYHNYLKSDIVFEGDIVTVDTTRPEKATIDGVPDVDIFQSVEDPDEWFRKDDLEFIDDPEDFVIEIEVFPYDSEEDKDINNSGYRIGNVNVKYSNSANALSSTDVVHNYLRQLLGIADEYKNANTWDPITNGANIEKLLKSDKTKIVFKPTPVDEDEIPKTEYNTFKQNLRELFSGGSYRKRIHNPKRYRTKRRKTSKKKYI